MSESDTTHSVGKTIAALRKARGYTQTVLADKLGVSAQAVSKWENEGGYPEVSQLPAIAGIFGVTIDYIMTGKKPEEKIIYKSVMERCAETDDPDLLAEITNLDGRNEKGQTFLQLIVEHGSAKVFDKLLKDNKITIKSGNAGEMIYLCVISNNLPWLTSTKFRDIGYATEKELSERSVLALLSDERVTPATFDYFLSMHIRDMRNNRGGETIYADMNWQELYPLVLDLAVKNDIEDRVDKILSVMEEIAKNALEKVKDRKERRATATITLKKAEYYSWGGYANLAEYRYRASAVSRNTMEYLLENHKFDLLERCGKLNSFIGGFVPESQTIKIEKLRDSKKYSEDEIFVFSCIDNGILNIRKLLASDNPELIAKTLNEYPIFTVEILYEYYKKKDWRGLFRFAVDNMFSTEDLVRNDPDAALEKYFDMLLKREFKGAEYSYGYDNSGRGVVKFPNNEYILDKHMYISDVGRRKNIHERFENIIGFINGLRESIIQETRLKAAYNKQTKDLSKEYFEDRLNKGEIDDVIIKLCVRLESYLRKRYNDANGLDLNGLIEKFAKESQIYNDWEGDYEESEEAQLFDSLRRHRNGIVHPSTGKGTKKLSIDEIKKCVELICSLK